MCYCDYCYIVIRHLHLFANPAFSNTYKRGGDKSPLMKTSAHAVRANTQNAAPATQQANTHDTHFEDKPRKARVTLVINTAIDKNVELFCIANNRKKTDVVVTALTEYLQRNSVQSPTQNPSARIAALLAGQI